METESIYIYKKGVYSFITGEITFLSSKDTDRTFGEVNLLKVDNINYDVDNILFSVKEVVLCTSTNVPKVFEGANFSIIRGSYKGFSIHNKLLNNLSDKGFSFGIIEDTNEFVYHPRTMIFLLKNYLKQNFIHINEIMLSKSAISRIDEEFTQLDVE